MYRTMVACSQSPLCMKPNRVVEPVLTILEVNPEPLQEAASLMNH